MKKNILIALLTVLAVAIIITILNSDKDTTQKEEVVQLPDTVFDATATAPGTRLVFSYPSNGFYGLGAEISTGSGYEGETERFIDIDPNSIYAAEKGSQLVNLRITAYNLPDEKASLEDFIHATFPSDFVEGYVKKSGEYREINGIRFLLVALVDKDPISRYAWTLVDNKVVEINLIYGLDNSPESQAALLNNDQLFLQILETIRLQ